VRSVSIFLLAGHLHLALVDLTNRDLYYRILGHPGYHILDLCDRFDLPEIVTMKELVMILFVIVVIQGFFISWMSNTLQKVPTTIELIQEHFFKAGFRRGANFGFDVIARSRQVGSDLDAITEEIENYETQADIELFEFKLNYENVTDEA